MVQRYNNKIKIATTIYNIYIYIQIRREVTENVLYKTIDLFKEVEFIYSMTGQETAVCLIEVTAWTNLTVSVIRY
jgi:hypothetical protein